jgi:tetratricopeptide (TPR) repeat protein
MRKASSRIRVTAELTDAESGTQIWSDRYDRNLTDIFDLQDELSRTVAAVAEPAVRGAEVERARRKPPASLSAYDLYLRALPHLWAATRDEMPKAIQLLQQSVALDAMSTPTLAALAWCLVWASPVGADASLKTRAEALSLARRAVEQESHDAFAQAVYGIALSMSDEHDLGLLHAQEAVRLNPSSAVAWGTLGMVSTWCGDFESAIKSLDRAIGLSPYDTLLYVWTTWLSLAHFALRRYAEGIACARKAVQQHPNFGTAHRLLAANLVLAERLEEARDVTHKRDATQTTTIRELRAMRLFQQEEVVERYLSAQRLAGVSE